MATWTNIPTHNTGDYPSATEWNNIANALNNGALTFNNTGYVTNLTGSASAPFFIASGTLEIQTNSSGQIGFNIPGGGFPNGVISVVLKPTTTNSAGTSQAGHSIQLDYSNTTKTVIYTVAYNQSGTAINTVNVRFSYVAFGF